MLNIWIFLVLFFTNILNIIVPISGSALVISLLALITEPHLALGLASFYFFLSGLVRVFFFRKNINKKEVKNLLPLSAPFAFIGAFFLLAISPLLLLLIVFIFSSYFLLKKMNFIKLKKENKLSSYLIGSLSGFLQGTGLAGSDLRNSYLYGKGMKIQEVHGTSSLIGTTNFFIATIVRLFTDQLTLPDLTPVLYLFPIIIIATFTGRHLLLKINKKTTNIIIIITMLIALILLGIKIIKFV